LSSGISPKHSSTLQYELLAEAASRNGQKKGSRGQRRAGIVSATRMSIEI